MEIREFRKMPFCWQDKPILRLINENISRRELNSVRGVYFTLTELASDYNSEDFKTFIFDISHQSGLHENTVSKCLNILKDLGIIEYPPQTKDTYGKYEKKEIRLTNANLSEHKFGTSSVQVQKKFDSGTCGYIEDNKKLSKNIYINEKNKSEIQKSTKSKKSEIQKLYLDFVKLTDTEYYKLIDKFGQEDTDNRIEKLNYYIGSKGDKYKSHYFTILNWDRKDNPKPKTSGINWKKYEDMWEERHDGTVSLEILELVMKYPKEERIGLAKELELVCGHLGRSVKQHLKNMDMADNY